jgi:hypothetical protein
MTKWDFNTRVVRPADKSFRVNVATGATPYGDHVQLGICAEPGFPGAPWLVAAFTPARARVIAHHLLEIADTLDPPKGLRKKTEGGRIMSFAGWIIAVAIVFLFISLIRAIVQDLRRKEGWVALAILIGILAIIHH